MNRKRTTQWGLGVMSVVLAAILLYAVFLSGGDRLSRHEEPPDEGFVVVEGPISCPLGTAGFVVSVRNEGDYAGEINHPYLEVLRDGKWYRLEHMVPEERTLELLALGPGGTKEFGIPLTTTRKALEPGSYRAVFEFVLYEGYFAVPFALTAA